MLVGLLLTFASTNCQPPPMRVLNFSINTTADTIDAKLGDGLCETNTAGQCTLRAAIMEANAHRRPMGEYITIRFEVDGIFYLTIPGANEDSAQSGDMDIKENISIIGNGLDKTVIDGSGDTYHDRIFHIDPAGLGVTVSISDLTVQNGYAGEGGGVQNGVCRMKNISICNSNALASQLTLNNVMILSNIASGLPYSSGGGVLNNGILKLKNVIIDRNKASVGGGLSNTSLATATLTTVTITNNVSEVTTGNPAGGGGIMNDADAEIRLKDCFVKDNTAQSPGGGIANFGTIEIETSNITNNSTSQFGGAFYNKGIGKATDVTFANNIAGSGGGINNGTDGDLSLERVTINGNSALGLGGAGISNGGKLQLTNVTISSNNAIRTGGGISITGSGDATLTNVTISENMARTGGGIGTSPNGVITIINSIIANSQASDNCYGALISKGYNLESGKSCGLLGPGDLSNINPLLMPLANNGGFTLTQALLSRIPLERFPGWSTPGFFIFTPTPSDLTFPAEQFISPAIDTGSSTICPSTDQRGVARPQGRGCDIGAYEYP